MNSENPPNSAPRKNTRTLRNQYSIPTVSETRIKADRFGLLYDERWNASIRDYVAWYFSYKPIIQSVTWMGIPTRKFVNDLWMYQEIVHERRPDFIVEIGSWYGGATLFLAHLLDNLGSGQVVSVDISRHDYQIRHPRVIEVTANSNDLSTFEKVREICHGGTVMVIHDGAHGCDDVLRDLTLYGPLVSPGQYLIVEDGVIDLFENVPRTIGAKFHTKYPLGGPLRAIATFLETPPRVFEIDETRERFLMTASPRGYLLKTSQS